LEKRGVRRKRKKKTGMGRKWFGLGRRVALLKREDGEGAQKRRVMRNRLRRKKEKNIDSHQVH